MTRTLAAELPPARTEPLDRSDPAFAAMARDERRLAEEFLGADEVLFAVQTASRVDVGRWRGGGRLWAFALRDQLALVAHGPRPYAERIPYSHVRESTYNPVTGELVLAPPHHLKVRGLRMAPLEGYQMLAQIHKEAMADAPAPD
ncbi:MAG: hypothetical protein FJ290_20805 [Planctomycetes bacterium]|nr:hypothetical protein [Planctomycetota bacterium]